MVNFDDTHRSDTRLRKKGNFDKIFKLKKRHSCTTKLVLYFCSFFIHQRVGFSCCILTGGTHTLLRITHARALDRFLHWRFVSLGAVHDDATLGGTGRHFGSLATAIAVQLQQVGQVEAGLLQDLDLRIKQTQLTIGHCTFAHHQTITLRM